MFGFLKRKKKPEPESRYGHIDGRGVFVFGRPGGFKMRQIDAFEADARLRQFGEDERWAEHVTILRTAAMAEKVVALKAEAQRQKRAAFEALVKLSRDVFSLNGVECEDGWSAAEAFSLFYDYLNSVREVASEFLPLPSALARPAD
jgi:hypothetical protein